jgi:predicted nucleotidyltransferase
VETLNEESESGRCPVSPGSFESIILAQLRRMSKEEIKSFPYISEGLENRIKASADNSGSLDELLESIDTRRYTRTRIQRCLINILSGLSKTELDSFVKAGGPRYIRVLGFNSKGRSLLSEINKRASLPVIIKAADFKNTSDPLNNRMLEVESASTDIYVLGYTNPEFRKAGQEFTQNVVRIE